jgi:CRISPR system Cascade subunit CasB
VNNHTGAQEQQDPVRTATRTSGNEERRFVNMLKRLAGYKVGAAGQEEQGEKNLGALAALRRGLGRAPGTAGEMYPYVTPYLPANARRSEEDAYFLIAALFAWHQVDWPSGEEPPDTSFGASYRRLADVTGSESIERRFVALLNAHPDDLPEHLRHAVGLLKSKGIPIDWTRLLRDVMRWNHPDRYVQRTWSRSYWRG